MSIAELKAELHQQIDQCADEQLLQWALEVLHDTEADDTALIQQRLELAEREDKWMSYAEFKAKMESHIQQRYGA